MSFIPYYSILNYLSLFLFLSGWKQTSMPIKKKCAYYVIQSIIIILQYYFLIVLFINSKFVVDISHLAPSVSQLQPYYDMFGTKHPLAISIVFFFLSFCCLLFVREETSSQVKQQQEEETQEIKDNSKKSSTFYNWFFFFLSKYYQFIHINIYRPIFYYGYYCILLAWMYFYPSILSLPLIFFIFMDLLFTHTSDYYMNRQFVMQYINTELGSVEDNMGTIEVILESLYERCVLLPNTIWRTITLYYTIFIQINSFLGTISFSYGISYPSDYFLFVLYGNHVGTGFRNDCYGQILLFTGLLFYSFVYFLLFLFLLSSSIVNVMKRVY